MNYYAKKEQARNKAIEWQIKFCKHNYSWCDMKHYNDYFEKIGKRYGLLKEFKENGIL